MKSVAKLTEPDLDRIMSSMRAEAAAKGWIVAFAVVDGGGHLLSFHRMDGSRPVAVEMALQKAKTAAHTGYPTRVWEDLLPKKPGIVTMGGGYLFSVGGLPIFRDGECIGGIGIGGMAEEGEALCEVGLGALAQA